MYTKYLYLLAIVTVAIGGTAQDDRINIGHTYTSVNDGVYDKEHIGARRPIPYTPLREADVAWEKRVWRDIDLREKQNLQLYFPVENIQNRTSLFQALTRHILKGDLMAFMDEEFTIPYELPAIRQKLIQRDTIDQIEYDEKGNEHTWRLPVWDSTSIFREVLKFRIKEDWFFDRQRSVMDVRIIGLAAYQYVEDKEAYRELFWVYFPACRPYLADKDVCNIKNDAERRSFDDIFWKRQFSSTIVKESNVYDRYISEYAKGIDALEESDRVKMDIFRWEHDLWHF